MVWFHIFCHLLKRMASPTSHILALPCAVESAVWELWCQTHLCFHPVFTCCLALILPQTLTSAIKFPLSCKIIPKVTLTYSKLMEANVLVPSICRLKNEFSTEAQEIWLLRNLYKSFSFPTVREPVQNIMTFCDIAT